MVDPSPPARATSRLTIDLGAIAENYSRISARLNPGAKAAGVVKANAYGLGAELAAPVLEQRGCPWFFVATLDEGISLRRITAKPIAVLGGYLQGNEGDFTAHRLIPVINSVEDAVSETFSGDRIWHVDTGMNRLGIRPEDAERLILTLRHNLFPSMLMSHFACADEAGHPLNEAQAERFFKLAGCFKAKSPEIKLSLCNSSAIFRNASWHGDLVRPGMALYGLNPTPETKNPMCRVVTLETRLLEVKPAKAGETVGYGASHVLGKDTVLGICGLGYADGLLRSGSNRVRFFRQSLPCPVLGRISMDLIAIDLGKTDPAPRQGDWIEVIGPHQDPDELAASCGTIGYEILTSLGPRSERIVLPA